MMGKLYEALLSAHVPIDQAKQAAEEAAGYETRLARIETDVAILRWMVGINITLTLLVLGKLFVV
jgi:hypothetical protein